MYDLLVPARPARPDAAWHSALFYKVAAENKYPTEWVTFSFMATVTLMSAVAYFFDDPTAPDMGFLLVAALINSASFLVATVSHIEALKYVPANIAYSIIRLNVVVVAVFSIVYFKEHVSLLQILGLIVAVVAMILLTTQMGADTPALKRRRKGAVFIVLAVLGGAAASVSSKFAAIYADKFAFMAMSYLFGMIGTLGINKALSYKRATKKDWLLWGWVFSWADLILRDSTCFYMPWNAVLCP